jgi:muconolactone delta-isomerase
MKQFLVDIALPDSLTEDFIALIPSQRRQVDKLFLEGKLYFYSLAFDRSRLWIGVKADSEEEVWNILYTFPLIEYFNADVHEVAFHNTLKSSIYELSLN